MHDRPCEPPDPTAPVEVVAARPADTRRLGRRLAGALGPGDVICLSGPMGAGKSEFARAVIRARLGDPRAEVPSPTYTLVNVFAAPEPGGPEIWHADLYRIDDAAELAEFGLDDAAGRAILLVEWPERWPAPPPRRLEVAIAVGPDEARRLSLRPHGPGWAAALAALGAAP